MAAGHAAHVILGRILGASIRHRTATPPARRASSPARQRAAVSLAAVALAALSTLVLHSEPGDDAEVLRSALVRAADRLVEQQRPDGSWPAVGQGPGDLATAGRPASALLVAWRATGDARYLAAARRTGAHLEEALRPESRSATTANLLFLAELGRATRRPELVERAALLRARRLDAGALADGAAAARALSARPNRTKWMDGAWRNYLLWHGGEAADLARAVGDPGWADAYTLELAAAWAPKHDHAWWTMGAGRALEGLAQVPGERARRLADAETSALLNNQLLPGVPWNETPYDSHVYALESAAALQGLLASGEPEARRLAVEGATWLAFQQLPEGGWSPRVSLAEGGDEAQHAVDESAEVNAEVLVALADALAELDALAEQPRTDLASAAPAPLPHAG